MLKTCSKCGKNKPLEDYNNNKSYKDGKMNSCRTCCSISNKQRYENQTDHIKKKAKEYRDSHKEERRISAKKWRDSRLQKERDRRKKWRDENLNTIRELTAKRRAMKKKCNN